MHFSEESLLSPRIEKLAWSCRTRWNFRCSWRNGCDFRKPHSLSKKNRRWSQNLSVFNRISFVYFCLFCSGFALGSGKILYFMWILYRIIKLYLSKNFIIIFKTDLLTLPSTCSMYNSERMAVFPPTEGLLIFCGFIFGFTDGTFQDFIANELSNFQYFALIIYSNNFKDDF